MAKSDYYDGWVHALMRVKVVVDTELKKYNSLRDIECAVKEVKNNG